MAYLAVSANLARMGLTGMQTWITGTLQPAFVAFRTAFENWKNPSERTTVRTAVLRDTEAAFVPLYRHLYTGLLKNNPLVTDADLVTMGMPERSNAGRKASSVSKESPNAFVKTPNPGIVEIFFGTKPHGMRGAEICWALLDKPPLNWTELIHSSFNTASPLRLSFDGNQRGRRLYFAIRWENTRGEKGPWSEIQDTVIP
jgi:hypothetical protein